MSQLPAGNPPVRDLPVAPPVEPVAPVEGSAEYNTQIAMTAQASIPAKFRKADGTVDADLLLKSYQAMEQMQRGTPPDPAAGVPVPSADALLQTPTPPATVPATSTPGTIDAILSQEKPTAPVINWGSVRDGTATEADLANIQKLGVPEDFIKQFAADRKVAKELAIAEVAEAVGGEENLKATLLWAQENKSPAEWDALRKAVSEGGQSKTLLMGLHAQFKAANPESQLVMPADGGVGAVTPAVQPYATQAEMLADMGELDAQGREIYKYDPAKQKAVGLRIFVTNGGDPRDFEARYKPATDY